MNPAEPNAAVGYSDTLLDNKFTKRGFTLAELIHLESRCGSIDFTSYQDIVVEKKAE
ncbi:hypothetical protein [Shouchella patagoniensis]|uniref:hypothetical protein n=1 Tax=Shouchella patagoniensis TaxID=228576 RepID=UPI001473583E|nr:hypothetical protein [Shouchella patagoniensis]